jgi:hypothetical protein
MKKRIREAVERRGLSKEKIIKLTDLEDIAREAKCDLLDVMFYLRYERKEI